MSRDSTHGPQLFRYFTTLVDYRLQSKAPVVYKNVKQYAYSMRKLTVRKIVIKRYVHACAITSMIVLKCPKDRYTLITHFTQVTFC